MNNLNTQELRQQLESHVLTIETLRGESRSLMTRHENELQSALEEKQKEMGSLNALSAELRNSVKDLNERLSASMQSRVDADEIIQR
ncbi:hypothetical protein B296_00049316 [Ensete ventricosum]|uniref:Uncharacterized protein n=1 Tax=Ensete ventricosum TaxID=4639 RepID=A0A426YMM5_ENSVE|nr:hypothetical protein B296_00049316 [Ensete ventricosum]